MMRQWQLQEAKARLSELVKKACSEGPQEITLHGRPEVIVMSRKDYDRAICKKPSFAEFMKASPLYGVELDLERDKSLTRPIDL